MMKPITGLAAAKGTAFGKAGDGDPGRAGWKSPLCPLISLSGGADAPNAGGFRPETEFLSGMSLRDQEFLSLSGIKT